MNAEWKKVYPAKRVAALFLAMILTFGLAMPVYADGETPVCTLTEGCTLSAGHDGECAVPAPAEEPVCSCTALCTAEAANAECPVCAADHTKCAYVEPEKPVAQIVGGGTYTSIQAAVDVAPSGATIQIIDNISLICDDTDDTVSVSTKYQTLVSIAGKSVTIDLNGKKLFCEEKCNDGVLNNAGLLGFFATQANGHLTLIDSVGGGTVQISSNGHVYGLLVNFDDTSSMTINAGTYILNHARDSLCYTGGTKGIIVNGGTFSLGNVGTGSNGSPWIFNASGQGKSHVLVTGGTFNDNVFRQHWRQEVQMPEDNVVGIKDNGDGTWTVVDATIHVNEHASTYRYDMGYTSLEEAIENAKDQQNIKGQYANDPTANLEYGETVTLLEDVTVGNCTINKQIQFASENGSRLLVAGDLTIENISIITGVGSSWSCPIVLADPNATVTLSEAHKDIKSYVSSGSAAYELEWNQDETVASLKLITEEIAVGDTTITVPRGSESDSTGTPITVKPNDGFHAATEITLQNSNGLDKDVSVISGAEVKGNPADGSVTLPAGSSFDQNGKTVTAGEAGLILHADGSIEVPQNGTVTVDGNTVTLPSGGEVEVNSDGTVSLPNGGTVSVGGVNVKVPAPAVVDPQSGKIDLPSGGTIAVGDSEITLPAGADIVPGTNGIVIEGTDSATVNGNNVTVPDSGNGQTGGSIQVDGSGNVTLPEDSSVVAPDGTVVKLPNGGTIDPDGTVTAPAGSTITKPGDPNDPADDIIIQVNPQGSGNATVGADGKTEIPAGSTITKPGDPDDPDDDVIIQVSPNGNASVGSDGNIELPAGSTVTKDDITVTLPNDGVMNEEGAVSSGGGFVSKNEDGDTVITPIPDDDDDPDTITVGNVTVTVPDGSDVIVDDEGNVTVPAGGSASAGETTVTLPESGTVQDNGEGGLIITPAPDGDEEDDTIIVNGNEVTVPDGESATMDENGNVTVPEGSTVKTEDGSDVTLPDGGVIHPDGSITVPEGGSVIIGGVEMELPEGGTVRIEDDGTVTVDPTDDKLVIEDTGDVTLPDDGTVTVKPDGTVVLPEDTVVDSDGDGKSDINVDTDEDGKADVNIDTDSNGKPDVNIDTDGDNKADTNLDTDGNGKADTNLDTDGNGKADTNIDTDGDGKADTNIDTDGDNKADTNLDIDGNGKADTNLDTDGNGKADTNIDTDSDGKADVNIDNDGDNKADTNLDTDGNGKADTNLDTDSDGKADVNIDTDGDNKADTNLDTDGNGKADTNIDADSDGKADVNIDTDGDNKADTNLDTDGNGKADTNLDTDSDGKVDINVDTDGDNKADINIDTDGDNKADLNVDTDGNGAADENVDTNGDGKPDYAVISGANGIYTLNTEGSLTFRVNGLFSGFTGVEVDGKVLAASNYEAKAGSTIVTLKKAYLEQLSVGKHTLKVKFADGEATCTFWVSRTGNPQTGDDSSVLLWMSLMLLTGTVAFSTAAQDKKRRLH